MSIVIGRRVAKKPKKKAKLASLTVSQIVQVIINFPALTRVRQKDGNSLRNQQIAATIQKEN